MAASNEGPGGKSGTSSQNSAMEALEKQVTQLRKEIGKINRTLAERAEEVSDEVGGWYESAADRASRAATALRSQAQSVSGAVKENPGTVSSAMLLGGMIGVMVGLVISQHSARDHNWFDRR